MSSDFLLRAASADRNKQDLLELLKGIITNDNCLDILEIASGTGQHATYFAKAFGKTTWQPSDCNERSISSISAYIQELDSHNVKQPLWIDTTEPVENWGGGALSASSFDLVLCVNLTHISDWSVTEGLFRGCGHYLKEGGSLALYGPFKINGVISPDSNYQFDLMLRQQNSAWGLRDTEDIKKIASCNGLSLIESVNMPANNNTLIFQKS